MLVYCPETITASSNTEKAFSRLEFVKGHIASVLAHKTRGGLPDLDQVVLCRAAHEPRIVPVEAEV